jgi:predicted metal-dependent hydrolase
MLAPEAVVDYLVAHEVSHLKHRNHSKSFWDHVEKIYPEFKPARKWLKDHGHTLTV